MKARHWLIGSAGLAATVVAVSASGLLRPIDLRHGKPTPTGAAHLHAFGGRSLQQRGADDSRLDAALADISRHASLVHSSTAIADLHALNPAARFRQATASSAAEVLVDATTRGDPQQLKAALLGLGLEQPAVFANVVGGWLPVSAIAAVAARPEVAFIHASMPHKRSVGPVATQGDFAQGSYAARVAYPSLTGAGVTVGVISDSYDCYAVYAQSGSGVPASGLNGYASNGFTATAEDDIASGALPAAGVNVLAEPYTTNPPSPTGNCLNYGAPTQLPFSDEGRAMLQVVHAVAPGAALAFYTGDNSEADFANGIMKLASPVSSGGAGARVIADDLGYFDEPFYQDGIIAQAIDTVATQGVSYFSAAGNNGDATYENTAPMFGTAQPAGGPNAGERLLNFDTSGASTTTSLPIHLEPLVPGEFVAIVVEWDQPYVTGAPNSGGARSQIDLCVTGATSGFSITNADNSPVTCTGLNATGVDPYQLLVIGNPADATKNTSAADLDLVVGVGGTTPVLPGRILVAVETDGQTTPAPISAYATNSASIQGHPGAAGAAAVAAAFYYVTPACGTTPAEVEAYSSLGGAPILFDVNGNALATPIVRQKPNFVGPDGINDTFLGFQLQTGDVTTSIPQCQTNVNLPSFFGTSAATPHAAGIAALMLQANSAATPAQIISALETSALPIGAVPTTGSNPTYNFTAGYGFIQAGPALQQLPGGPPMLSLSSNAIAQGGSATISWSSVGAASCAASSTLDPGDWSGPKQVSGTQTLTPTTTGIFTYSLTCTDAAGSVSPATTVSLAAGVVPPAPTLNLGEAAIPLGASTTIAWTSEYASSCTASGSWSGTLGANGTQTITPTTEGAYTYSLLCMNVSGNSTPTSVTLTVNEPVPATPTLTLSATAIAVGSTTTISWASTNATGCTASGAWSGMLPASGSQVLTPTSVGTDIYDLSCANSSGGSAQASVTLTVAAKPSSGGGGGGLDGLSLLLLGGLTALGRYPKTRNTARPRARGPSPRC